MSEPDSEFKREVRELERHLRQAGFPLTSLNDWIRGPTPIAAESVLLEWLEKTKSDEVRDFIARTLTQKGFKRAVPALLKAFRDASNDSTRWAIGNAISRIGFKQEHWDEILSIASDRTLGRGRQTIVETLHRVKRPETESVLLSLLSDLDVQVFALRALSFCASYAAYQQIKTLTDEGRSPLFRRTLREAIPRLERKLRMRPN